MKRREADSCYLLFALLWLLYGFLWLGGYIGSLVPGVNRVLLWVLYTSAIGCSLALLIWMPGTLNNIRKKRERCPHGIAGGNSSDRCEQCLQAREECEKALEAARKKCELQHQIAETAERLRLRQLTLLSQERLQCQEELLSLSPRDFENVCAEMFRRLGFTVDQTPYSNDGGKDAILEKKGHKYVAEFKRFGRDKTVGRPHLQKFFAAIQDEDAEAGFFLTTGSFTESAVRYAHKTGMRLIDADALVAMMRRAFRSNDTLKCLEAMCLECGRTHTFDRVGGFAQLRCHCGNMVTCDLLEAPISADSVLSIPVCGLCGRPMRIVTGQRGQFWGCAGYPRCRFTRPYSGVPDKV